MRRAAKVDANQSEIIAAFRKFGCSVYPTHSLGSGFPDLVVGKNRKNLLIEIKDGSKPASAKALTKDEKRFHEEWQGTVVIVEDLSDVIAIVRGLEK